MLPFVISFTKYFFYFRGKKVCRGKKVRLADQKYLLQILMAEI